MIDKTSPVPMYYQLKEMLENLIKSGELKPGDRIYSENELCEMYDVSRITAKRALDEMVKGRVSVSVTRQRKFRSGQEN